MRTDIKQQYEEGYLGKENYAYPWGCFGCPFPCQPIFNIPEAGGIMVWRCYPTYWPWRIWITDMKIAFEATRLMSDYGLENREIATEISWLMHLYRDGVISAKDTDGVPFDRGSKEALFATIRKVANREGFGAVLGEGPVAFAKKLGSKAQEYLIQSRGATMRTFDFRLEPGTALGEAISSRGNSLRATTYHLINWGARAKSEGIPGVTPEQHKVNKIWAKEKFGTDETINPFAYNGKPAALIFEMHGAAISDSLGFCTTHSRPERFGLPGSQAGDPSYKFAAERFTAATGMPLNESGLFQIAERIINVERAFVIRDGRTRATDTLPEFFFNKGIPDGPHEGRKLDKVKFERMKDEYYSLRGWDVHSGIPTRKKLEELDLKDIADNLKKTGKLTTSSKA
jgi:aldehyde:ferredoxin oxidoreductase